MVTCPKCETTYRAERLGIKIGPRDQSILWCKVCGAKLLVKGREVELPTGSPVRGGWRQLWQLQPAPVVKIVKFLVELLDGN